MCIHNYNEIAAFNNNRNHIYDSDLKLLKHKENRATSSIDLNVIAEISSAKRMIITK